MTDTTLPDYAALAPKVMGLGPAPAAPPTADAVPDYKTLALTRTAQAVRNTMQFAPAANPDDEAKYRHLAQFIGAPLDTVRADPAAATARASLLATDADRLAAAFPSTAATLSDPSNARMLHDDVSNVAATEGTVQALAAQPQRGVWSDMWSGLKSTVNKISAFNERYSLAGRDNPAAQADAARLDLQAREQAPQHIPGQIVAGLTYAPYGAAAPFVVGASEGNAREQELLAQGVDPDAARLDAAQYGGLQGLIQLIPLGRTVFGQGPRALLKSTAATTARAAVVGGAQSAVSDTATQQILQGVGTDQGVVDQYAPSWDKIVANAAFMGGLHAGTQMVTHGHEGIGKAPPDPVETADAQQATQTMGLLQKLGELATAGKFRERDSDAFKQFVADVSDSTGAPDLFVDARKFAEVLDQGKVSAADLAAKMPDVAAQMREGLQSEGMIKIPLEDYAQHIAGGPLDPGLLPHLRTDPAGMSFDEAQKFYQGQVDSLTPEAQKLAVDDKALADANTQELQGVHDTVLDQLTATGRYRPEVSKAYAALTRDFYGTTAQRLGVSPAKLFADHPLRIEGEGIAGEHLDQVPTEPTTFTDKTGEDHSITMKAEAFGHGVTQPNSLVVRAHDAEGKPTGFIDFDVRKDGVLTAANTQVKPEYRNRGLAEALYRAARDAGYDIAPGQVQTDKGLKMVESLQAKGIINREAEGQRFRAGNLELAQSGNFAEQVPRESFGWHEEDDGFLYHVTSEPNAARIISSGFDGKAQKMFKGGAYGNYSKGKTFFTERSGVKFWESRVEDHLFDQHDEPPEVAIVRVPKSVFEGKLKADETGTEDANHGAYFVDNADLPKAQFDQDARGTYSPATNTITALHNADLSTYLHELGHHFLETYARLAAEPGAPADIVSDVAKLLPEGVSAADWLKGSLDERRDVHENFARGFEAYLMEGKAPTVELQSLFGRFRSWLVQVYKSLSALRVQLSPEVRGVMDRMLATQTEIEQAQKVRGMESLFAAKPEGMSDADFKNYQELGNQSTEDAISDLQARGLRDMKWLSNAKSKAMRELQRQADTERATIREQVTQEVEASPAFAAKDYLDRETDPNKAHKQALAEWRTNRNAQPKATRDAWIKDNPAPTKPRTVVDDWNDARKVVEDQAREAAEKAAAGDAKGLKKGQALAKARRSIENDVERATLDWGTANPKPKVDRPQVDLELTAEKFGFATADEMLGAIHDAGSKKEAIDGMTDQRMLEEHGDLVDPRSIERAAEAAVHNAARTRFIATELKGLAKAVGSAGLLAKAARAAADSAIAVKRVRDLRPDQYSAAEARASKASTKAFLKGDTQEAAIQKRAQLLSNALARSAAEAAADIAKGVEYLKRFDKASVRDRIDVEYRDQIDAILAKHDVRTSVSNKALNTRKSIQEWVEEQQALGNEPMIPQDIVDEANLTHFKDMTVESFRGMADAVKSIEHLGKAVQKIRDGNDARDFRAVVDEAVAHMGALPQRTPETNRGLSALDAKWMNVKAAGRGVDASLLKMEQVIDWLDNHESTGVFNRVVMKRIADAQTRENDLRSEMVAKLHELAKSQPKGYGNDFDAKLTLNGLIDSKTGKTQVLLKRELLSAALNSGNESNYQKMLAGEKWSDKALQAAFDKHMIKADWDYVQGVLHAVNHLWPEIAAMERRLGNTAPTKVEARPIVTPHGTYEGGYYPAVYDPLRAFDVEQNRQRSAGTGLMDNNYQKATTSKGHTKERNENYARPILLSLDVIPRHMTQVIHDIAYREALMDADRFLADSRVRGGIENVLGREHYAQFRPWLQALANDKVYDARGLAFWDKAAHWARTTTTIVGLGYRLSTMMIHGATAASNSVGEIGTRWMLSGAKDVLGTPAKMAAARDFIFERSGEMRHRMNEVDRDIRDQLREMEAKSATGLTSSATNLVSSAKRGAFYGIAMLDMASAMPTWMGAYNKGLHEGLAEEQAVYAADKAVRNAHGGTGTKDLAAIQRGAEFQKLFTMFYSFWNHFYNRQRDIARAAGQLPGKLREGDYAGARRDFAMVLARSFFYFIAPQLLHAALKPPAPGSQDEDEGWVHWAAKEIALGLFSGVPVVRDLANATSTGRDYQPTPAVAIVKAAAASGKDVLAVANGQPPSDRWLAHAVQTTGYVFGLPTGQVSNSVQYLWDVADGKQDPQGLADWWHGIKDGHQ